MTLDLNYLDRLLANQLKACNTLLQVSLTEQTAIINNEVEKINTVNAQKKSILELLYKLDQEKKAFLKNFALEYRLKQIPLSIESIIKDLPAFIQPKINSYINATKQLSSKIKAINTNNSRLVDYSLSFISYVTNNFLTGNKATTYCSEGKVKEKAQISKFEYCS